MYLIEYSNENTLDYYVFFSKSRNAKKHLTEQGAFDGSRILIAPAHCTKRANKAHKAHYNQTGVAFTGAICEDGKIKQIPAYEF
jgi:hypothetical protein